MGRPFAWKRGRLLARLSGNEKQVVAMLCDELTQLLADPTPDPDVPEWARELGLTDSRQSRSAPDDPVVARLLPDGYSDPEEAQEFRRMTEAGLRATKLAHLSVVREAVERKGNLDITDDAQAWLSMLADARLALGTRLGVTDETEIEPGDQPLGDLYLYAGWLQQSLVDELMGSL